MKKKDCKIIQDLLPNYIEGLTNEATNSFIEVHLKECKECGDIYHNMKENFYKQEAEEKVNVNFLKKYRKQLNVLKISILVLLVISLGVMVYYYFYFRNAYFHAANNLVEMATTYMYPNTFYATIEEISDSEFYNTKRFKVKGMDINSIKFRGEFYFDIDLDNIGDNFKIKWNETDLDFEHLKVGQKIAVYKYNTGEITNSDSNVLSGVRKIEILDDEI